MQYFMMNTVKRIQVRPYNAAKTRRRAPTSWHTILRNLAIICILCVAIQLLAPSIVGDRLSTTISLNEDRGLYSNDRDSIKTGKNNVSRTDAIIDKLIADSPWRWTDVAEDDLFWSHVASAHSSDLIFNDRISNSNSANGFTRELNRLLGFRPMSAAQNSMKVVVLGTKHLNSTELESAWSADKFSNVEIVRIDSIGGNLLSSAEYLKNSQVIIVDSFDAWKLAILAAPPTAVIVQLNQMILKDLYQSLADSRNLRVVQHRSNSIQTLARLITHSLKFTTSKFLMFMPWEQLNNQMIEFKVACSLAIQLKRTLVLPLVGYRHPGFDVDKNWDFSFQISEFDWVAMAAYFDLDALNDLECPWITAENYQSLFYSTFEVSKSKVTRETAPGIGPLYFNPFAKATLIGQLGDYYWSTLKMPYTQLITLPRQYQITKDEVQKTFNSPVESSLHTLALGCTFWMYGFERNQPYPLDKFFDYMDHVEYRSISKTVYSSIRGRENIVNVRTFALQVMSQMRNDKDTFSIGVHMRRGDYWKKCKNIKDEAMRNKCFPDIDKVIKTLSAHIPTDKQVIVYVATNVSPAERTEFKLIEDKFNVTYLDTVLSKMNSAPLLDTVDSPLLDMMTCVETDLFIGNLYSSFSRSVLEMRTLQKKDSLTF